MVPRVAMEMASVEVLLRLVELGFGVTIVPAITAAGRTRLQALPVRGLARREVALITATVGSLSPAARAFAGILRSCAQRRPRAG